MNTGRLRNRQVKFYVTDDEYRLLHKKAKRYGMSVGKYIREKSIHSDGKPAPTIDIGPLKSIEHELKKQGTNLNQLMYFLNAYGIEGYNAEEVRRVIGLKGDAYLKLCSVFGSLRDEAERHHVHIIDTVEGDEDNEQ